MEEQFNEQYDEQQDIQSNKVMAILSYIGFLFIIPLLSSTKSKYARFHLNQGIILFIAAAIYEALMQILNHSLLGFFPFSIAKIPFELLQVVFLIFTIVGIVHACNGEKTELPFIGHFKILS